MDGDSPAGAEAAKGLRIGRYRVDAVLGTGAFSTVYRAVDERLDDVVAVKVLAENHSLDVELRERFLTEGRVLRRIAGPHVVAVHDVGETARQQPFLVLEHADRGTLRQRVTDLAGRGWRARVADVWAVAEPLAQALAAMHRAGVVHRDLNPANVLIATRGRRAPGSPTAVVGWDERLLLADLGLCKDLALNSGHTSAGGTEGFRPPELRRGPAVIDGRADLWSLSALVVWLATGAPPGDLPAEAAMAATGLPVGLARALDRSLAVAPAARHPDPHAWLVDVASALGDVA
ncbi:MAG: serine/threonine-protein kinase, partial [Acidimicrobiia bacterium]